MARPIRIQFEGAVYHVTARGNERHDIFRDDRDRRRFLETLEECNDRFMLVVHVFCLMRNHYHLAVQTPRANLSQALGWLQTTYSIRFNRRHRRSGHLFQGRFKAHLVDADEYAQQLVVYTHLNPVRPRNKRAIIPSERRAELTRYRWSSHRSYLGLTAAADWLSLDWLGYWGRRRAEAQRAYRRQISACFGEVVANPFHDLRDGVVLGSDTLWQKAHVLLSRSKGQEEIKWQRRATEREIGRRLAVLVDREGDDRVKIWMRVRLGGERLTVLAKELGYKDGSGVLRVAQRVEARSKGDQKLAGRLKRLRSQIHLSRVKS